jgi:hypothetical protein
MPKKIIDLSARKNQFILDQLAGFEELVNSAAFSLSEKLVQDFMDQLSVSAGQIDSTTENVNKIPLIEKAWNQFEQQQGARVITTFVSDLKQIMDLGAGYYTELIPKQVASEEVLSIINKRLGLEWSGGQWTPVKDGYIDSLIKDRSIVTEIKNIAYKNVIASAGPTTLRKALENYIKGSSSAPGEYYNFFKQFSFNTYSEVDRLNSVLHADRLGLRYFLYNGGVILDSREFCRERHGKCFSTDETSVWRDLIGKFEVRQGKTKEIKVPIGPIPDIPDTALYKKLYDPLRDLGGNQCRHSADFVSEEIALTLRAGKP